MLCKSFTRNISRPANRSPLKAGALAVPDALSILPTLNTLLALPFAQKIATRDAHPAHHISFASSHPAPNNTPFESTAEATNPLNSAEKSTIRLWPDHCIAGTHGAELVSDLKTELLDVVVDKATHVDIEMLSAFASSFADPPAGDTGLADRLRRAGVSDVFVVGLAADYCVKMTALGAAHAGFKTWVIEDAVRGIDCSSENEQRVRSECREQGVEFVRSDGPELQRVKDLA